MRTANALVATVTLALSSAAALPAAGVVVRGRDFARLLPPAGAPVEPYRNAGYELTFAEGGVVVRVDLAPLASAAPFTLPPRPAAPTAIETAARQIARGAATRYEAVGRVLAWIRGEIRYVLDRDAPQDAAAVLARRSAYCAGTARLAVALLAALGIEAREVPGYVFEASAAAGEVQPGFHRWIEVLYPDRGWVFSDPLASHHFVPATYLRLASDGLEDAPAPGQLLARRSAIEAVDVVPAAPLGVRLRANDERRLAAGLVLAVEGAQAAEALLVGQGLRQSLPVVGGEARFLGLAMGNYELKVHRGGRLAAWKNLTFREPVLARLVIPADAVATAAGGGR